MSPVVYRIYTRLMYSVDSTDNISISTGYDVRWYHVDKCAFLFPEIDIPNSYFLGTELRIS